MLTKDEIIKRLSTLGYDMTEYDDVSIVQIYANLSQIQRDEDISACFSLINQQIQAGAFPGMPPNQ